jgi:hypothetical protein
MGLHDFQIIDFSISLLLKQGKMKLKTFDSPNELIITFDGLKNLGANAFKK